MDTHDGFKFRRSKDREERRGKNQTNIIHGGWYNHLMEWLQESHAKSNKNVGYFIISLFLVVWFQVVGELVIDDEEGGDKSKALVDSC